MCQKTELEPTSLAVHVLHLDTYVLRGAATVTYALDHDKFLALIAPATEPSVAASTEAKGSKTRVRQQGLWVLEVGGGSTFGNCPRRKDDQRAQLVVATAAEEAGQELVERVPDGRVAFYVKVTRGWDHGSQRFTRGALNATYQSASTPHLNHKQLHSTGARRVSAEVTGTSQKQASAPTFPAHLI